MSLRSRDKNLSLGKIGFLPTKCPQRSPIHVTDGKRPAEGAVGQDPSIWPLHPVLTHAGSLHTLHHELLCQPGPPTSFEGCSGNEAGMDRSPMRLKRCLGGKFCIMCPVLDPVGEEDYKPEARPEAPGHPGRGLPSALRNHPGDRTAHRSPDQALCQVDTAKELLVLEWPGARASAGRMQVEQRTW